MKRKTKAIIIVLVSIILVIGLVVCLLYSKLDYEYKEVTSTPEKLGFEEKIDEQILNIALFGIDSREITEKSEYSGNADTIMILSVNTITKKIKVISVMRDSLVPIEKSTGKTYYKINAAYSWGGPTLAIKTLNQNFNLDISEYATINFYGLADIIDTLGGVDIELTENEVTYRGNNRHGINDYIEEICTFKELNPDDYYINEPGVHHLNGIQAVAYSRQRYCPNIFGTNNDYGRTDRQRYVLKQIFEKVSNLKKTKYLSLASAIVPYLETSLSRKEIIDLGARFMMTKPTFEEYRIPQNTKEMNFTMPAPRGSFGSVVYYDLSYASKVLHAIIYDDLTLEEFVSNNPIEKNDWYNKR